MRDVTLSELEQLGADGRRREDTFQMDEDAFRLFYERTARPVWAYLSRMTGDARLADDLLQEAYYRFLRANVTPRERRAPPQLPVPDRHQPGARPCGGVRASTRRRCADGDAIDHADPRVGRRRRAARSAALDLARSMARLKPRERDLLWLAYAQGSSHKEIAETLGLKTASIKLLLFRARRRLAGLLRGGGR